MIKDAERYIDDVISGKIEISKTTLMTFQRHKRDLRNAPEMGWYFDKKRVERVYGFCNLLKHSPDKRSWVPFKPEPWQAAIIYIIFGWYKRDGSRRFNYAYIEIPKKNGKTTFAAVFADYLLFFDGENEAEVYCAASVEKQAKICFGMSKKMIEKSPSLKKRARLLTRNVSYLDTSSKMEPLGRDSASMEGINPSGAIIDEYHVWKSNEVFENIQSATVARRQPLTVIITTAGRDKNLPCFNYRSLIIDILKGVKTQDDTFGIIFTLDDDDDWKDPHVWKKANPNWGISVIPERFEAEFQGALNDPTKEVSFKTKNLNLWVDAPTVWIKDEIWQRCFHKTNPDDLLNQKCYASIDLASHVDINALALFFPDIKGRPVMKWLFWIPEDKVKEKEDRVDYRTWIKKGWMKITPGGVIDIDTMSDDIYSELQKYDVEVLGYDPYMAHHGLIQSLEKMGFPVDKMVQYSQSLKNMSPATKEFERIITTGELDHLNNPVARWMMGNVVLLSDTNDNKRPDKKRSIEKIDGIVAAIMAVGCWLESINSDDNIYRGSAGILIDF